MELVREEKEPRRFSTAEEYISHFGIIPVRATRYTVVYYTRAMVSTVEWEYLKKTVNVRTGVYRCYRLSGKPRAEISF